jgi:hypothetical protein
MHNRPFPSSTDIKSTRTSIEPLKHSASLFTTYLEMKKKNVFFHTMHLCVSYDSHNK